MNRGGARQGGSAALLVAALLAGCGSAQGGPEGGEAAAKSSATSSAKSSATSSATSPASDDGWRRQATRCRASALMPPPVKERGMREGPVIARLAWGVGGDGSRYEIACFDGPTPLSPEDSADLLSIIERRISGSPGTRVTGRREVRVGELPAIELHLALPEDRAGRYWIFLVEAQRLFEVSVVGPLGEPFTAGAERFFGSFRIEPAAPAAK